MQYFKYAILQIENCKSQFCIFTIVFFEFDILKNQFFKIARYRQEICFAHGFARYENEKRRGGRFFTGYSTSAQ